MIGMKDISLLKWKTYLSTNKQLTLCNGNVIHKTSKWKQGKINKPIVLVTKCTVSNQETMDGEMTQIDKAKLCIGNRTKKECEQKSVFSLIIFLSNHKS